MSTIHEMALSGLPLNGYEIIDSHSHLGHISNFNNSRCTAEYLLKNMDAMGVRSACISTALAIDVNYKAGNDLMIETITKYPERFHGFLVINPHFPEDIQPEIERCLKFKGVRGIKLHPAGHNCMPDYKNYHLVYEKAQEHKLPMLIHTWGSADLEAIDRLAPLYPDASFIMGHSGAYLRSMEDAIDLANKYDNVYGDLAISLAYEGNVEWFVKEMGSHKVLYGTDMPYFSPTPNFSRVALADISDEEKRNVLGRNIKKLLKL